MLFLPSRPSDNDDLREITPKSDFTRRVAITYAHPDGTKFADITKVIMAILSSSGVQEGFVLVKSLDRNSAVLVQEARQSVEADLASILQRYSNIPNLGFLFQPYQALPIIGGKLKLGTYQSILIAKQKGLGKPHLSIVPVAGRLETHWIDTGNFAVPAYQSSESNYAERGSEMVFDITEMITGAVGQASCAVFAGTANTTCVLYQDTKGEGVEGLLKRINGLVPPHLPISDYAHNNLEARVNIPPDERRNGRAHVIAALLQPSILFPASALDGQFYLVELDGPRKGRQLHIGIAEGVTYQKLINLLE